MIKREEFELLPLEINAQLTEINKWLKIFGSDSIALKGLKVDIATSTYALLMSFTFEFPKCKLPFYMIYDKLYGFVMSYYDHFEAKYNKNKEV